MAGSRNRNVTILIVSVLLLAVTLVLAYATEYFASFQGSWLVILGWFLLAVAAVTALAIKRGQAPGLLVLRNITFVLGVVVIVLSLALAIWVYREFNPFWG
jgi:hypothetical protein